MSHHFSSPGISQTPGKAAPALPFGPPAAPTNRRNPFSATRLSEAGISQFDDIAKQEREGEDAFYRDQSRQQSAAAQQQKLIQDANAEQEKQRQKALDLDVTRAELGMAKAPETMTRTQREALEKKAADEETKIKRAAPATVATSLRESPAFNERTDKSWLPFGMGKEPTPAAKELQDRAAAMDAPGYTPSASDLDQYRKINPTAFSELDSFKSTLESDKVASEQRTAAELAVARAKAIKDGLSPEEVDSLLGKPAASSAVEADTLDIDTRKASMARIESEVNSLATRESELTAEMQKGATSTRFDEIKQELATVSQQRTAKAAELTSQQKQVQDSAAALETKKKAQVEQSLSGQNPAILDTALKTAKVLADGSFETSQPEKIEALAKAGKKVFYSDGKQDAKPPTDAIRKEKKALTESKIKDISETAATLRAGSLKISENIQARVNRGDITKEQGDDEWDSEIEDYSKQNEAKQAELGQHLNDAVMDFKEGVIDASTLNAIYHAAGQPETGVEAFKEYKAALDAEDAHVAEVQKVLNANQTGELTGKSSELVNVKGTSYGRQLLYDLATIVVPGLNPGELKGGGFLGPEGYAQAQAGKVAQITGEIDKLRAEKHAKMSEVLTKRGVDIGDQARIIARAELEDVGEEAPRIGFGEAIEAQGGGIKGAASAITEKAPLAGGFYKAAKALPYGELIERLEAGEQLEAGELDALTEFVRYSQREGTPILKFVEGSGDLVSFATEIGLTGGASALVKNVAAKGVLQTIKTAFTWAGTKQAVAKLAQAKAALLMSGKVSGGTIAKAIAAKTLGAVPQTGKFVFGTGANKTLAAFVDDKATQGIGLTEQEGKIIAALDRTGELTGEARHSQGRMAVDAIFGQAKEFTTEKVGAAMPLLGKALGKAAPKAAAAWGGLSSAAKNNVVALAMARLLKKINPLKQNGDIAKFMRAAGKQGLGMELFEERVGDVADAAYGWFQDGKFDLKLPTAENFAVEVAVMLLPMGLGAAQSTRADNRMNKAIADSDAESSARIANIFGDPDATAADMAARAPALGVTPVDITNARNLIGPIETTEGVRKSDQRHIDLLVRASKAEDAGDMQKAFNLKQMALEESRSKADMAMSDVFNAVQVNKQIGGWRDLAANLERQAKASNLDPKDKKGLENDVKEMKADAHLASALVKIARGLEAELTKDETKSLKTPDGPAYEKGIISQGAIDRVRAFAPSVEAFIKPEVEMIQKQISAQKGAAQAVAPPGAGNAAPQSGGSSAAAASPSSTAAPAAQTAPANAPTNAPAGKVWRVMGSDTFVDIPHDMAKNADEAQKIAIGRRTDPRYRLPEDERPTEVQEIDTTSTAGTTSAPSGTVQPAETGTLVPDSTVIPPSGTGSTQPTGGAIDRKAFIAEKLNDALKNIGSAFSSITFNKSGKRGAVEPESESVNFDLDAIDLQTLEITDPAALQLEIEKVVEEEVHHVETVKLLKRRAKKLGKKHDDLAAESWNDVTPELRKRVELLYNYGKSFPAGMPDSSKGYELYRFYTQMAKSGQITEGANFPESIKGLSKKAYNELVGFLRDLGTWMIEQLPKMPPAKRKQFKKDVAAVVKAVKALENYAKKSKPAKGAPDGGLVSGSGASTGTTDAGASPPSSAAPADKAQTTKKASSQTDAERLLGPVSDVARSLMVDGWEFAQNDTRDGSFYLKKGGKFKHYNADGSPFDEAADVAPEKPASTPKSSTQFTLSAADAKPILDFGKSIPKDELFESVDPEWSDGALEDEPHVTVLYGLTKHDAAPVQKVIADHGPVTITLGKLSIFENDQYDVLKVDIEGADLRSLNAKLTKLPNENSFPDYKPHMTVAYLKKGEGKKYVGDARFDGREITFDTMTFSPPKDLRGKLGRPELKLVTPKATDSKVAENGNSEDPKQEAKREALKKGFAGLFSSRRPVPEPSMEQVDIPKDNRMAIMEAAGVLVDNDVDTPEQLIRDLDDISPALRKYADAFWNVMRGFNSKLAKDPVWPDVFDVLDNDLRAMEKADLKAWAKAQKVETLPENPDAYFITEGALMVDISKLIPEKDPDTQPQSVNNALAFAKAASQGRMNKRGPIHVRDNGNGTYSVIDGNATYGMAARSDWNQLPVIVTELGDKLQFEAAFEARKAQFADKKAAFDDGTRKAAASLPDATPLIPPLKGARRSVEKMGQKRAEFLALANNPNATAEEREDALKKADINRLVDGMEDILRASIIVDTIDQRVGAIAALKEQFGEENVLLKEDRFAVPTPAGYSDIQLQVIVAPGMIAEMQIHIPEMLAVKEGDNVKEMGVPERYWPENMGIRGLDPKYPGHKYYEVQRNPETPQRRREILFQIQQRLYGYAKEAYMARTGQSSAFPANSLNSSSETILLPTSSPVGAGLGDGVLSSLPGREDAPTTENATPSSTTMGGSPAKNLEPGLNDSSLSTPEATGEQQTNQDVWKTLEFAEAVAMKGAQVRDKKTGKSLGKLGNVRGGMSGAIAAVSNPKGTKLLSSLEILVPTTPSQSAASPNSYAGKARVLADGIFSLIESRQKMTWEQLFKMADSAFGGTQASGAYTVKDAYDSMEMAINRFILSQPQFGKSSTPGQAIENIQALKAMMANLPTQTKRTEEMDAFQQFSTVPPLAYVANWTANITQADTMLESSAGIGGLAVFAKNAGARVVANELSKRRAALLKETGIPDEMLIEDGEQIANLLRPMGIRPTVTVINPPFSTAATRGVKTTMNAAKHLEAALNSMPEGGRLVAIVGSGMAMNMPTFAGWWTKMQGKYHVRANIQVNGAEYAKYGTTWDNQLVVIDKVTAPAGAAPVVGRVESIDELPALLDTIRNERPRVSESISGAIGGTRPSRPASNGSPRNEASGTSSTTSQRPARPEPTGARVAEQVSQSEQSTGSGSNRARLDQSPAGNTAGERGDSEQESGGRVSGQDSSIAPNREDKITDAVYDRYEPRIKFKGAHMPPTELAESAAMAAVNPPTVKYRPKIDLKVYADPDAKPEDQRLAAHALEAITLAGHNHQQMIPAPIITGNELEEWEKKYGKPPASEFRRGMYIGDGTGAGKGRQIAGIILDNWNQGRKRAVWLSKSSLLDDARRDMNDVANMGHQVFPLNDFKAGDKVTKQEGITFLGYETLRSGEQTPEEGKLPKSRVDQLVEWLGEDFDGVIAFDEAHKMANAMVVAGDRGAKGASSQALAGLELQQRLPNARVVYLSATGATEVANLAYAERLGLWGPGTPFSDRGKFVSSISAGGVAAMELIAQNLKAMGLYVSRSISWHTVSYNRLTHPLTKEQRKIYNDLAEGWQTVLRNFEAALELTGATEKNEDTGGQKTKNTNARKNALSKFWGTHQRFFNGLITAMKLPTVITAMEKALDNNQSVVIQLVNTNQASLERGLSKAAKEAADAGDQIDYEALDISPRDQLLELIQRSFPTTQYEDYEYLDANGNSKKGSRAVMDSSGAPVQNAEAIALRDALLDKLSSIPVPAGPLEMLIDHFGADKVAEVTGRTRRVVWKKNKEGKMERGPEKRSKVVALREGKEFQDGKRRILVFSNAGGTGASYHASRRAKNQQKRLHIMLQPGWQAAEAIQGLGRTHRNDQVSSPHVSLAESDVVGEKRFMSSIARRLDQLGALTRGQRETGSQGLFQARDNLESQEAKDALSSFYTDVLAGRIEDIPESVLSEQMGLKLRDSTGSVRMDLPPIQSFLNRLLSLRLDDQQRVFDAFSSRLDDIIQGKIETGTLDVGMETIEADKIVETSRETVYNDPKSGAKAELVTLAVTNPTKLIGWETVLNAAKSFRKEPVWFKNKRTGKMFVATAQRDQTTSGGAIEQMLRLAAPTHGSWVNLQQLNDRYERWSAPEAQAESEWNKQKAEAPQTHTTEKNLLIGTMLPIWDKIPGLPRIVRAQTDAGARMIGRQIPRELIDKMRRGLGMDGETMTAAQAVDSVQDGGTAKLSNEWRLKRSGVSGEQRIEIIGPRLEDHGLLTQAGVMLERIQWNMRYFVPTDGAAVLEKVLSNFNATVEEIGDGTLGASERPTSASDAEYLAAVKAGDMETAQQMVDEAAQSAGYATKDFWRAVKRDGARGELQSRENSYVTDDVDAARDYKQGLNYALQRVYIKKGKRLNVNSIQELQEILPNEEFNEDGYLFEELDRQSIRDAIWELGYDMVKFPDVSIDNSREHDAWLIKSQGSIKSGMPITRDDQGNIIPLSQRFNPESNSILYSATRPARLGIDDDVVADALDELDALPESERERVNKIAGYDLITNEEQAAQAAAIKQEGTSQFYDETRDRENHRAWSKWANDTYNADPEGSIRKIVLEARNGFTGHSGQQAKLAMLVLEKLSRKAAFTGDAQMLRDVEAVTLAFDLRSTLAGREIAARWQPHATMEEQHRTTIAKAIFGPTGETRRKLDEAMSRASKNERIRELEAQVTKLLADLKARQAKPMKPAEKTTFVTDKKTLDKLRKDLERVKLAKTEAELLAEQNQTRLDEVREMFEESGFTMEEVMIDEAARLKLQSSPMVKKVLESFNPMERVAIRAIIEGKSDRAASIESKISRDNIRKVEARFDEALNNELDSWIDRGFTPDDMDRPDFASFMDKKGKLFASIRPQPGGITMAQRQKLRQSWRNAIHPPARVRNNTARKRLKSKKGKGTGLRIRNPQHAITVMRVLQREDTSGFDRVYEYWINGILSGIGTHTANVAGNMANVMLEYGLQRWVEAGANMIIGDAKGATAGELITMSKWVAGAAVTAFKQAKEAWNYEVSSFDWDAMGTHPKLDSLSVDGKTGFIHRLAIAGTKGRIIRIPSRALLFMDEFTKYFVGTIEAAAQGHRIAKAEKLTGAAFDDRVNELVRIPGSPAWVLALEKAQEMTFQQDLPKMLADAQKLLNAKSKSKLGATVRFALKMIFPFIKTPYNILAAGLRKSPLGSVRLAGKAVTGGYKGKGAELSHDLAEQVIAAFVMMLVSGMAEGDPDDDKKPILITGTRGRDDRSEANFLNRSKGGETTVLFYGKPVFHYGRFAPLAVTVATIVNSLREMKKIPNGKDKIAVASSIFGDFVNTARSQTFLAGFDGLVNFVNSLSRESEGTEVQKAVKFLMNGAIPNIVRQTTRNLDEQVRDSKNAPWYYHAVPYGDLAEPLYDLYGRPAMKGGTALSRLFVTEPARVESVAPADVLLGRWNQLNPVQKEGDGSSYFPSDLTKASFKFKDSAGKYQDMTPAEIREFRRRVGVEISTQSAGLSTVPIQENIDELKKIRGSAAEKVKKEMFGGGVRPVLKSAPSLSQLLLGK